QTSLFEHIDSRFAAKRPGSPDGTGTLKKGRITARPALQSNPSRRATASHGLQAPTAVPATALSGTRLRETRRAPGDPPQRDSAREAGATPLRPRQPRRGFSGRARATRRRSRRKARAALPAAEASANSG